MSDIVKRLRQNHAAVKQLYSMDLSILLDAANRIEALEAEVEVANRNRDAGRDNFHAMQQAAYKLAQKLEAAEASASSLEQRLRDAGVEL